MAYIIDDECDACGISVPECPTDAITIVGGYALLIERFCSDCGSCADVCPQDAIRPW